MCLVNFWVDWKAGNSQASDRVRTRRLRTSKTVFLTTVYFQQLLSFCWDLKIPVSPVRIVLTPVWRNCLLVSILFSSKIFDKYDLSVKYQSLLAVVPIQCQESGVPSFNLFVYQLSTQIAGGGQSLAWTTENTQLRVSGLQLVSVFSFTLFAIINHNFVQVAIRRRRSLTRLEVGGGGGALVKRIAPKLNASCFDSPYEYCKLMHFLLNMLKKNQY